MGGKGPALWDVMCCMTSCATSVGVQVPPGLGAARSCARRAARTLQPGRDATAAQYAVCLAFHSCGEGTTRAHPSLSRLHCCRASPPPLHAALGPALRSPGAHSTVVSGLRPLAFGPVWIYKYRFVTFT